MQYYKLINTNHFKTKVMENSKIDLFEAKKANNSSIFSLVGNNHSRTGWIVSRLGKRNKEMIINALNDSYTNSVYKRNGKIYCQLLNGNTNELK